jgi:hypothetical protein
MATSFALRNTDFAAWMMCCGGVNAHKGPQKYVRSST